MRIFLRGIEAGVIAACLILAAVSLPAQQPAQQRSGTLAFPGAEGFGATASGGRGKPVRAVTNLNDDGPGSFRAAVSLDGATVVFRVSGVIHLKSNLELASDLTLAGQTAPGSGITVADAKVSLTHSHNIIIRYMRFRGGIAESPKVSSINLADAANVMLDHLSIEWGRWDNIQTNGNTYSTIQHSIIGQGIVPQRFGCLCESDYLTLSHNLWIDNKSRNPKGKGHIQYINNVVYNWGVTGYVGGHGAADHYADLIGNYFIAGPDSSPNFIGEFTRTDHTYMAGNYVDMDRNGSLDGRPVTADDLEHANGDSMPQPFAKPAVPVRIEPATTLIQHLTADVGDTLCRDAVDQHLIGEVLSFGRSGKLIADETETGGLPPQIVDAAPLDTDGDGIPDVWEKRHHLNPKDASDGPAIDPETGYSHLELYLNDLKAGCNEAHSTQNAGRAGRSKWDGTEEFCRDASQPRCHPRAPLTTVMEILRRPKTRETILHFVNFKQDALAPFTVHLRQAMVPMVKSAMLFLPELDEPLRLDVTATGATNSIIVTGMRTYGMLALAHV